MRVPSLIFGLCLLSATSVFAEKAIPIVYYSRAAPDYKRKPGPDGKPAAEYYALSYGGKIDGTTWNDGFSKDDYPKIAGVVAEYLAKQNYFYATNAADAKLLLVLNWGQTLPANQGNFSQQVNDLGAALNTMKDVLANAPAPPDTSSQEAAAGAAEQAAAQQQAEQQAADALNSALAGMELENSARDRRNEEIARILGYVDEMRNMSDLGGFAGTDRFTIMRNELEDPRFYIVLTAYDFKEATQKGKRKILWTSRISIDTRGNDFMGRMQQMIARAANSFGENTRRLVRERIGEVEIGEAIVVGTEDPDEAQKP